MSKWFAKEVNVYELRSELERLQGHDESHCLPSGYEIVSVTPMYSNRFLIIYKVN